MDLSTIRELARTLLSEPTPSYWSNSELNNYINYGLRDFCSRTNVLEDISTDSLVAYQHIYDLPTDYTKIKQVRVTRGSSEYLTIPEDIREEFTGIVRTTSSPPSHYTLWGQELLLRERPASAATATTLDGTITSTATDLDVASATGLPRTGRILIDSEVIGYGLITDETLSVLTRGMEGTTAAAHTTAAVVTNRDLWIYHFKKNATLSDDTDTPAIPTEFHEAPAYYAAALGRRKSKDHDLAREYKQVYDEFVAKAVDWSRLKWKRAYTTK